MREYNDIIRARPSHQLVCLLEIMEQGPESDFLIISLFEAHD